MNLLIIIPIGLIVLIAVAIIAGAIGHEQQIRNRRGNKAALKVIENNNG